jgi:hypothetical protein
MDSALVVASSAFGSLNEADSVVTYIGRLRLEREGCDCYLHVYLAFVRPQTF